jgi:hypothetical protein
LLVAVLYAIAELVFVYNFWRAFFGWAAGTYFWTGSFILHLALSIPALMIFVSSSIQTISQSLTIGGVYVCVVLYTSWLTFAAVASAILFLRTRQEEKLP